MERHLGSPVLKNCQIMRHAASFAGYDFRAGRELSRASTVIYGLPRIQKGSDDELDDELDDESGANAHRQVVVIK